MKKIVLLITLACACTAASARQFCEEGKTWHYWKKYIYTGDTNPGEHYYYTMQGDSIMADGRSAKKFYRNGGYKGAFREEESGEVYYYAPGKGEGQLYYHFGLSEGAEIPPLQQSEHYEVEYLRLTSIDRLDTGMRTYKWRVGIQMQAEAWEYETLWIEGVGNLEDPLEPQGWEYGMVWGMYNYYLVTCTVGEDTLYINKKLVEELESGLLGIAPQQSSPNAPSSTYSLDGRKLSAPTAKGLHIKDGKVSIGR